MKRVLFALALFVFPLSVMAMTPVSDATLSDVTGQSGVNINVDLTMDVNIGTVAWGDDNGLGGMSAWGWNTVGQTAGGYIGVNDFNLTNLRIKNRETDSYDYTPATDWKPITVDVATGGAHGAGITFVRFGLGSLEIRLDAMSLEVGLDDWASASSVSLTQILGTVSLGDMAVYISPGSYVDIYTAAGVGVNIAMNVQIDHFDMGYLSWGDTDGLNAGNPGTTGGVVWMATNTGTAGAGYVGLDGLHVGGPITIIGTVRIDVVTSASGAYSTLAGGQVSVVHIGFGTTTSDFVIDVNGPIYADVKLGDQPDFSGTNWKTLGNFYMDEFVLTIHRGSWVDIWAH